VYHVQPPSKNTQSDYGHSIIGSASPVDIGIDWRSNLPGNRFTSQRHHGCDRRPHREEIQSDLRFGSKFDSLADQFIQISAVFWVLILMPEVYTDNLWITIAAVGTYLASLTVGLIKFKRLANLHLYLTKLGGIFLYTFVIHAFLFGQYNRGLYLVAVLFLLLSHAECLFLQLTSSEVNAHSGSILFRYLERDHPLRYWLSRLP
jgi:hypothetical protein